MTNISDAMYENLQQILEKQNGRTHTFEEAKKNGDRFVDFFTLLIELEYEESE